MIYYREWWKSLRSSVDGHLFSPRLLFGSALKSEKKKWNQKKNLHFAINYHRSNQRWERTKKKIEMFKSCLVWEILRETKKKTFLNRCTEEERPDADPLSMTIMMMDIIVAVIDCGLFFSLSLSKLSKTNAIENIFARWFE